MAIMEAVYYRTSVAAIRAIGPSLTLQGKRGHVLCDSDEQIIDWILGDYPDERELAESAEMMIREYSWDRTASAFLNQIEEQRGKAHGRPSDPA